MAQSLGQKVALVTGGGSGIGEGIARRLSEEGAAVAITGRRQEVLDTVVASIEDREGKALAVAGDVSDRRDVARMVEETVSAFGALHIVVNNAGIARGGPLEGMSDDDVDHTIDIDLKGPIYVLQAALPHLKKHRDQGGSSVINISSSVTQTVLKNFSVYSAAKAGLNQLTRCLALDLAADGVRINAICPGVVDTPIFQTVMPEDAAKRFVESSADVTPLGRPGQPKDVAELALFLAGDRSEWMTGSVVTLDGGISLAGNV